MKLPISAIVVSCNEGHLLLKCLSSLNFCNEIIVVDLESTDSTEVVAKEFNATYIKHKKVPVVEQIHTWIQDKIENDWLLITDPDEVCSKELANDIRLFFNTADSSVGAVRVPEKFYFKSKLLKGTQWGGLHTRIFLVHLKRFYFTNEVHRGRHLKKGYRIYTIPYKGANFVHHFWMLSWKQLIDKHKRYLTKEGESRYNKGGRANRKIIIKTPIKSFRESFIEKKGYQDGLVGLLLSLFWSWYETNCQIELFRFQQKISNNL